MVPLKNRLKWWIGAFHGLQNASFTYLGNILTHGCQQDDSYSCGIVSYNAIAHDLFADELWTIKTRRRQRIDCFNMIVLRYNQSVSRFLGSLSNQSSPFSLQCPAASLVASHPLPSSTSAVPHGSGPDIDSRSPQAPRDRMGPSDSKSSCGSDSHRASSEKPRKVSEPRRLQAPRDRPVGVDIDDPERILHPSCAILQVQAADPASDLSDQSTDSWVEVDSACGSPPSSTIASFSSEEMTNSYEVIDSPYLQNMDVDASEPTTKRPRELPEAPEKKRKKKKQKKRRTIDDFFKRDGPASPGSESSESEVEVEEDQERKGTGREKRTVKSDRDFVGQSRSALHSQKLRAARLNGTQTLNTTRYDKFKAEIRRVDRDAQFNPEEWSVRHTRCCKWIKMKSPFSAKYFLDHVQRCKAGCNLHDFSFTAPPCKSDTNTNGTNGPPSNRSCSKSMYCYETCSCSGLTIAHDPRIGTYLNRATALGGGGRSRTSIAQERYGGPYGNLDGHQKAEVDRLYESTWLWVIKPQHGTIFSTSCLKTLEILVPNNEVVDDSNRTCSNCYGVLRDKRFRTAISVPEPVPSNTKYVNKQYQHEEIGLKFARCKGVDELIQPKVSFFLYIFTN